MATQFAQVYINLGGKDSPANIQDFKKYLRENPSLKSRIKVVFYNYLYKEVKSLNVEILKRIDNDLDSTSDIDPEVRRLWYPICLGLKYQPVYEPAHTWISSMGRIKYLKNVYKALAKSGQQDLGNSWFEQNKNFYHPVAASVIKSVLDKNYEEEEEDQS